MSQDSPFNARAASSYNRRRAGNACTICRNRKTKCDNQRPVCGFCAATGGECRYMDSNPSQLDRASLAILQRISQLETSLIRHIDETVGHRTADYAESGREPGLSSLMDDMESHSALISQGADSDEAREHVPSFISSHAPSGPSGRTHDVDDEMTGGAADNLPPSSSVLLQASEMFVDSVLQWPIFSKAAPHLAEELHVPILKVMARPAKGVTFSNEISDNMGSTLLHLNSDILNNLVANFLENNHIKNPVLDVQTLCNDASEFAESGPKWDGKSCLILLVCAISSISSPLDLEHGPGPSKRKDRLVIAEVYFQAAQRRIGMLYHDNSLISAQCSFLTAVFLMSTMRVLAAWKCFVQAGNQCLTWLASQGRMQIANQDEGMTSAEQANQSVHGRDQEKRHVEESLYWSCLKSELELRFELGLPGSGLNEIRYQNLYPSPPESLATQRGKSSYDTQETACQSRTSRTIATDQVKLETGWFFYLAEIALKRIVHNVIIRQYKMKRRHGLNPRQREEDGSDLEKAVAESDTQIQEWYNTLPLPVKFDRRPEAPAHDILRFILRGHMADIMEMARFPAIHAALASPTCISSDELSPASVRLAREFLENAVYRIESNREGFFHRHQGTWLLLRSASRSALQLLGMAIKCHLEAEARDLNRQELETWILPNRWMEAVKAVSELLEYWSDESKDVERLSFVLRELTRYYEESSSLRKEAG